MKPTILALFSALVLHNTAYGGQAGQTASAASNPYFLETFNDNYVVRVYADEFRRLPLNEKIRMYHFTQAGAKSRDLTFAMSHRHALKARNFLENLYLGYRRLKERGEANEATFACIEDFLKTFYLWHGPYVWGGRSKITMNCKYEEVEEASKAILKASAGTTDLATLRELRPLLFDPAHEPWVTGPNGELGTTTFYDPALRREEIERFRKEKYPHKYYPANTYLKKTGAGIQEVYYRTGGTDLPLPYAMPDEGRFNELQARISAIGEDPSRSKEKAGLEEARDRIYFDWVDGMLRSFIKGNHGAFPKGNVPAGPYAEILREVVREIEAAMAHTNRRKDPNDFAALEFTKRYFQSGDAAYGYVSWLAFNRAASSTIFTVGFDDGYADPFKVMGAWKHGALYRLANPVVQAMTEPELMLDLQNSIPWDPKYNNPQPRANSVFADLMLSVGALCPACWSGFNTNDDHLGRFAESKSVIVANWALARMAGAPPSSVREFYLPGPAAERIATRAPELRKIHVILHESLGHAIGLRAPGYGEILAPNGDMLEEARAEAAALYLLGDPRVMKLAGWSADDLAAWYLGYVTTALRDFTRIPEGAGAFGRPHEKAANLIANYLRENGYGVAAVDASGDPWKSGEKVFYAVRDVSRMREGLGKLLAEVMEALGKPDKAKAAELAKNYAEPVNPEWLDQIRRRAAASGFKTQWVGLFPELKLVRNGARKITDVRVVHPKDFLSQQLRLSGRTSAD